MEAGGEPTTELEELRNLEEVKNNYGWEADDKVYLKRQKSILQKWMAKEKNNTALVKLEGGGGASSSGLKKKKTLFDWEREGIALQGGCTSKSRAPPEGGGLDPRKACVTC
jgi:hypothetical protein